MSVVDDLLNVPLKAPEPPREKFRLLMGAREQGVVTSVFDLEVPAGFNPAALMVEVNGSGYFMPPSFDVWIPADMILGIARVRDDKMVTESKVLPFKAIDGGKNGTPPPVSG